jgi:serine/threonine protein kinase/Tol biopolymer transport system component
MTGQTVSHYTILEKLGEGGMGVVYKARDTKLDRDVALKFLPAHLGASENDKARFIQEAKAAAALNHPNVCSIIDIQEQPVAATPGARPESRMFIVMEFVDGQTLREKMGSMSSKQATDIGIQIADGLAAAHEKGIVHRDIKPENIMIRRDGIAQIMDFGLAKLRGNVTRLTREGSTVGTAGYMSPEQVQGQETDHRSDIFSMGVVLYELLAGQPPFKAAHESALMYEIVNVNPPPMASIKPEIDTELDRIVLGCLEKEPGDRTQAAKQVSVDLKRFRRESGRQNVSRITTVRNVSGITQPSGTVAAAPAPARKGSMIPWIVAGLAVVAAIAALFSYYKASKIEEPLFMASIPPPPASEYLLSDGGHLAISPDGKMIAFVVSDTSGKTMLWVRSLDSDIPRRLDETEGAEYPFWSYDSRFIGFFVPGKMKKVLATGGPPFVICDAPSGRGASWNQDDIILFSPKFDRTGLSRVSAAGGPVTIVTTVDSTRNMSNARWPHFLPDGKHFFYTTQAATRTSDFSGQVYVASLDGSVDKRLFDLSTNVEYRNGKILYVRQDALVVQNFDTGTLEVSGDPVPLINKIGYAPNRSKGVFSSSVDGVLIYLTVTNQGRALAWVDTRQHILVPTANVIIDNAAYLSADDSRVFYDSYDPIARNYDIWMLDISRGLKSRLTFDPSDDSNPIPSHDGSRFVYTSWKEGVNIYIKSTAGTDEPSMILKSLSYNTPSDWSADGRWLLFQDVGKRADQDIWYLPMEGERVKKPFIQTEFNEQDAVFSPDGKWVAYTSDESSRNEIYVRAFPAGEGKWQVSSSGGRNAYWGRDGKSIFYGSDQGIMATTVSVVGGAFVIGDSKVVFRNPAQAGLRLHGVNIDGSKLLVSHLPTSQGAVSLTLITDWRKMMSGR